MMPTPSTSAVILNLFQDPSGRKPGACRDEHNGSAPLPNNASARVEKWVLKQVQDDEVERVAA
jgi:hypothetical protein